MTAVQFAHKFTGNKTMRAALFIAALSVLALAACTEAQKDDAFAVSCAAVSAADTGFQIYAGTGKVRDSVMVAEQDAVAAAQAACDGPRPTDAKTALAAVNRALKAIAGATATARVQATGA